MFRRSVSAAMVPSPAGSRSNMRQRKFSVGRLHLHTTTRAFPDVVSPFQPGSFGDRVDERPAENHCARDPYGARGPENKQSQKES